MGRSRPGARVRRRRQLRRLGSRIIMPAAGPPALVHAGGRAPAAGPKGGTAPASLPSEVKGRLRPARAGGSAGARPAHSRPRASPNAAPDG